MACRASGHGPHTRGGFTLVELMVVVVVIALLAALLLPALSRALTRASVAADEALLHQIGMGLETYKQAFFEYVPSAWDAPGSASVTAGMTNPAFSQFIYPPPVVPAGGIDQNSIMLTGAGKLFSAMAGFNTWGCWDQANPAAYNVTNWVQPCGEITYRGIVVDTNWYDGNSPPQEDKVYGPYYTPKEQNQTRVRVQWGSGNAADQLVFSSRFERQTPSQPIVGEETAAPILYFRAERRPAHGPDSNTAINPWEMYYWRNNFPITNQNDALNAQWGPSNAYDGADTAWQHPLYATSDGIKADGNPGDADGNGLQDYGIVRPGTYDNNGVGQVFNADTFILISPGPDGEYFTEDDIKNF